MALFIGSILFGLCSLIWSADKFIQGASNIAKRYNVSPLLIGMIIIGFGTSTPEIVVSIMSALEGTPTIALGNAYGSNIANIALILGITALLKPIAVQSKILKIEFPVLLGATILTIVLAMDLTISRIDASLLIFIFITFVAWTIRLQVKHPKDQLAIDVSHELTYHEQSLKMSILYFVGGLFLLILSSRLLVYGATGISAIFKVPEVIVGLTIVGVGTSLPELAASIVAVKRGESDLALGNVIGSNLFNTLTVVGLSGVIEPISLTKEILTRDILVMSCLTVLLFVFGYRFKNSEGRINRLEGGLFLLSYVLYTVYLIITI